MLPQRWGVVDLYRCVVVKRRVKMLAVGLFDEQAVGGQSHNVRFEARPPGGAAGRVLTSTGTRPSSVSTR